MIPSVELLEARDCPSTMPDPTILGIARDAYVAVELQQQELMRQQIEATNQVTQQYLGFVGSFVIDSETGTLRPPIQQPDFATMWQNVRDEFGSQLWEIQDEFLATRDAYLSEIINYKSAVSEYTGQEVVGLCEIQGQSIAILADGSEWTPPVEQQQIDNWDADFVRALKLGGMLNEE